jgi:hypothetical protein
LKGVGKIQGCDAEKSGRSQRPIPEWKLLGDTPTPSGSERAKVAAPPISPVFLAKSAESLEKKRVEFRVGAKKCKKEQKSAERFERKGDR